MALHFYKLAIFISFHSENPTPFYKDLGWMLTHIHKIIYIVINPRPVLGHFCFQTIDGDIDAVPTV